MLPEMSSTTIRLVSIIDSDATWLGGAVTGESSSMFSVMVPLAINLAQASTEPVARTLTFCYKNDFHPNQTMAYLTACTLYAAVFNKSPEGLLFNKVTETKSQNIHGEAVADGEKTNALSSKVNPDGGPLERVFTDEERLFLQRTAWQAVEAFRKGEF